MKLEAKVVVAAIASILTPLAAGLLPDVDLAAIDAVVVGVVTLVVTFAAGYFAPHTPRPGTPQQPADPGGDLFG